MRQPRWQGHHPGRIARETTIAKESKFVTTEHVRNRLALRIPTVLRNVPDARRIWIAKGIAFVKTENAQPPKKNPSKMVVPNAL